MPFRRLASVFAVSSVLVFTEACGRKPSGEHHAGPVQTSLPPVVTASAESAAHTESIPPNRQARELYYSRCRTCHGDAGRGDGASGKALDVKPTDFSNKKWQIGASDESLRKVIIQGGKATGHSGLMPSNPDLANSPIVVEELVKIVRAFGMTDER